MISYNEKETLWVEAYRPQTIDDCILPPETKNMLQGFVEKGDIPNLLFCGHQGTGKAQPLTSKVLTPRGYKCMGDIVVGDRIVDGDGRVTSVTGIYPQGIRPVYRITLEDETFFDVSDEHINSVICTDEHDLNRIPFTRASDYEQHIVTTKLVELIEQGKTFAIKTVRCQFNNRLAEDTDCDLVARNLVENGECLSEDVLHSSPHTRTKVLSEIIRIQLANNIAEHHQYLVFKNNECCQQVAYLIRSLGQICQCCDSPDGNKSVKIFFPSVGRRIVSIKRLEDQPCQCLMVKSRTHQYVTDNFTVTHNTTVAKALANQLGYDVLFINASLENGIDVLRNKIATFASSISLVGSKKCVILDESDFFNANSMQQALRGFIEQFSQHVRFIFTCNYVSKNLPAVVSRCTQIDFEPSAADKNEMIKQTVRRMFMILKHKGVDFNPVDVGKLVVNHFPDIRRCINELQRYSATGRIDSGIFINLDHDNYYRLVDILRDSNFKDLRPWIGRNKDIPPEKIFDFFYDHCDEFVQPSDIPQLILTTDQYQYKAAFVRNQEINIASYLVELMANITFLPRQQ